MERTYLLWARFIGICGIVCVSFPVGKLHLLAPILLLAGIFFIIFLELRAIRKVHQARWDYERHILLDKERRELNVLTGAATTNGDDLDFRIRVGKLLMSPYPTHCKSEQIFQERLEALKKSPMPSKAPAPGGTQQRNEIMRLTKRTNII